MQKHCDIMLSPPTAAVVITLHNHLCTLRLYTHTRTHTHTLKTFRQIITLSSFSSQKPQQTNDCMTCAKGRPEDETNFHFQPNKKQRSLNATSLSAKNKTENEI